MVSFGKAQTAWVATVGLNPSLREFTDGKGNWLTGDQRRLATTDSLGVTDLSTAEDARVARVVEECYDYFHRNPYWKWFKPLETLINTAAGASYSDGTACHLDLVQWATEPVWQQLALQVRRQLIAEDREFLRQQLQWEHLRLVLLNGRTVLQQIAAMGVELAERAPAVVGDKSCAIVTGSVYGATFVGWSRNLQSSFGMSTALKNAIAERVKQEASAAGVAAPPGPDDSAAYIERGQTAHSKAELVALLRSWVAAKPATTHQGRGSVRREGLDRRAARRPQGGAQLRHQAGRGQGLPPARPEARRRRALARRGKPARQGEQGRLHDEG